MGIAALFEARGGLSIGNAHFLSGTGAPGGSGGRPDDALKGSMYLDESNGQMHLKKSTGTGADKWIRMQNQDDLDGALLGLSWREPAKVRDGASYANLTAAETALNTIPYEIDGVVVADGDRILFDDIIGAAKNIFLVSGTPGAGATLVEDGNAASKGDALYIQDGTDAGKQYAYNSVDWVQQGSASQTEIGFIHTFIGKSGNGSETPAYASNNVIIDGDSLESSVSDLDAEIGAGIATPLSRIVGSISDQSVNLNVEALDDAIGSDVTSSYHATPVGNINANISSLDAAVGANLIAFQARTAGEIGPQSVNQNIGALDDAIGANVTSTKIATAADNVNANISALDAVLGDAKTESKTDSVTTATTLDTVLVDDVLTVEWTVHARSTVTATNIWAGKILAIHNGHSGADATDVDYNTFAILKTGSAIPSLDFEVDVDGTGAAQTMRLRASSGQAANIRITRAVINEQ